MDDITKAVFPAAGLGTRFLPVTKALPKELLPLVDTPLIQYGIEEAVQSGFTDIYVITGRGKGAIEDYFDANVELEQVLSSRGSMDLLQTVTRISEKINVAYIRQREPKGLGHAVLCARSHLKGECFAVVLSDDVIHSEVPCLRQLIDVYRRFHNPVVALMRVPRPEVGSYGIIQGPAVDSAEGPNRVFRLERLIEKPHPSDAPSELAVIGRYILTPDIFELLDGVRPGVGDEIQLTDALNLMAATRPVYGVCFEGKRYDAGSKIGFLKATIDYALRRDDLRDELWRYLVELGAGGGS